MVMLLKAGMLAFLRWFKRNSSRLVDPNSLADVALSPSINNVKLVSRIPFLKKKNEIQRIVRYNPWLNL